MKIGIIVDRLNRSRTGIGNYVYNLVEQFVKMEECQDSIFYINYEDKGEYKQIIPTRNKIIMKNPFSAISKKSFYFWHIYLQLVLRKNNFSFDIVHSPENASLFMNLKPSKVITVYDTIPYFFPELFNPITRARYKLIFNKSLKCADKIITISENTKQDLIKYFKIPADKINVIYLAADTRFKPLNKIAIEPVKEKYGLNNPYILYVGNLEKRKNIARLVTAFGQLKKRNIAHKLVIVGMKQLKYEDIFTEIDKFSLQDDVIFTGYVPDEDLPAIYNLADLFVYVSLYEGFGLPPLEAMACGIPVITSNTSSLPEVVEGAGIMIDPYNVDDLENAMYNVLTDKKLHKEMSIKSLERAEMFSWKKCAKETLSVYEHLHRKIRS